MTLPARAVHNAVHNAAYDARRSKVSAYIHDHHTVLIQEITGDGGPHLIMASDLARIAQARRATFRLQLANDIAIYRTNPEALTVAFMVQGD